MPRVRFPKEQQGWLDRLNHYAERGGDCLRTMESGGPPVLSAVYDLVSTLALPRDVEDTMIGAAITPTAKVGRFVRRAKNIEKRRLMGEIRESSGSVDELIARMELIHSQNKNKIKSLQSTSNPLELTLYRGGDSPPVPGRGTFYSTNPLTAATFTGKNRGEPLERSFNDITKALKGVRATTVKLEKPLLLRNTPFVSHGKLGLESKRAGMSDSDVKFMSKLEDKLGPMEVVAGDDTERTLMHAERLLGRRAKAKGYDSIINENTGEVTVLK